MKINNLKRKSQYILEAVFTLCTDTFIVYLYFGNTICMYVWKGQQGHDPGKFFGCKLMTETNKSHLLCDQLSFSFIFEMKELYKISHLWVGVLMCSVRRNIWILFFNLFSSQSVIYIFMCMLQLFAKVQKVDFFVLK